MKVSSLERVALGIVIGLLLAATSASRAADKDAAPPSIALTGIVSSDAEGPMEGVIVKAKRVGGTITISVVTDEHGRYAFPADRLKPADYTLAIRARGYEAPKSTVTVGDKPASADLKLNKVGTFALAE